MRLNFRIDFGYQYLYSRRTYHPTYVWDGSMVCEGGEILRTYSLEYPNIWYGPVLNAKETLLENPNWNIQTKRRLAGLRFECEISEDAVFTFDTASAKLQFSAKDILDKGRLDYNVGPKYLGCRVMITLDGYLWYRLPLKDGERAYEPNELGKPTHTWARTNLAWLMPGESAKWEYEVSDVNCDLHETIIHTVAMAVPVYSSDDKSSVRGDFPLEILCDGKSVLKYNRHYRQHDTYVQLLEDDFKRVTATPGKHCFELRNHHPELCLGINRIIMSEAEYRDGDIIFPDWALVGEELCGRVFAKEASLITLSSSDGQVIDINCEPGFNAFKFAPKKSGMISLCTHTDTKELEVMSAAEEAHPVKVGFDLTAVPHNDDGFLDHVLQYTNDTRLANYILVRNFGDPPTPEMWKRYGQFFREHNIYAGISHQYEDGHFLRAAGEMLNDCGYHEYTGRVYALDPEDGYSSASMDEAMEKHIAHLKGAIDKVHSLGAPAAFGDASGGIRYSYLAGLDFVRAETMVGNTMTLLSQARPAAESLKDGRWGVHIAMQHNYMPYHENHLGMYFLSLFQPWMMGAELMYEEDSLFSVWKEERQAWDDLLAARKRDMTRAFLKFAKAHPRSGKCVRDIGFIEGRYAAPFNGFICGPEQDPHYSVWGMYGSTAPEWEHCQPEKCRQLLNVLMPGASTAPLRQKYDERRFFFAGTPYGDFDCVPIEASTDYLKNYKLLIHTGWSTATDEDYRKLIDYVKCGGTLLIGITELSTHKKRDFLADMEDLALYNGGDISELCGIKIRGKSGTEYSGVWNAEGKASMPKPKLISEPSDFYGEDGAAFIADTLLCGAECVAWDAENGKPLLVRYNLGDGFVYTFTFWAYPGHERFEELSAAWIERLAKSSRSNVYIEDPSGEVFFTKWENGDETTFMLLNTDWSEKGNIKTVKLITPQRFFDISVEERTAVLAKLADGKFMTEIYKLGE